MNEMIRQMIKPLLDAFDSYEIKSNALRAEVDAFRSELSAFAEKYDDFMKYYNDFTSSGLQEKYTDLISKVATMSYMGGEENASANAASDGGAGSGADATAADSGASTGAISVRDFLLQYKAPYEEIKKRGSRAEKIYEEIFAIADRTDDMLEAQIILEKERLLWKIVSEDALDVFEKKLEEMDPLYLATTAVLLSQIEVYKNVTSEEELTYHLTIKEQENYKIISDYVIRMNLAAMLAKETVEYIKAKEMVYDWFDDNGARMGIVTMISKKKNIRAILKLLDKFLNISSDDLFDDPGSAIWMLSPKNLDEYGRKKVVVSPKALVLFKGVINNEILSDISCVDALMR